MKASRHFFLSHPTFKNALFRALPSAFAIDIRITGILFPFFVPASFPFFLYDPKTREISKSKTAVIRKVLRRFRLTHRLMHFLHAPLVLLGLMGCVFPWLQAVWLYLDSKKVAALRFISLILLYYTLLHIIGAPFPRYSIPLRPLLYGMAIFSVHFMFQYLSSPQKKKFKKKLKNDI